MADFFEITDSGRAIIGTPTIDDASADTIIGASATDSKPLVLQLKATPTADAFQVQKSDNEVLLNVTSAGAVAGGNIASNNLTLLSTSHATKGKIYLGASGNSYYNEATNQLFIYAPTGSASIYVDNRVDNSITLDVHGISATDTNTGGQSAANGTALIYNGYNITGTVKKVLTLANGPNEGVGSGVGIGFGFTGTPTTRGWIEYILDRITPTRNGRFNFKTISEGALVTPLSLVKKDVIVNDGELKLATAGNGLYIKEGSNATMGRAALVAGTVTINTTKVTANSEIFLTNNVNGGTVGTPTVSARTAGTSFTITSTNAADTSTISWLIIEPA